MYIWFFWQTIQNIFYQTEYLREITALADLGGARPARAPPTGPDSFILTCKIFET